MTPVYQRIAIAEALGFTKICTLTWRGNIDPMPDWVEREERPEESLTNAYVPNFINDLNAMHEAEKVIIIGKKIHGFSATGIYTNVLSRISKTPIHAKASERAEGVLRTIGKWNDDL